jgi:putative acetyltransferase
MIIREEQESDIAGVRQVEELAFAREDEARLVDQLRSAGKVTLSMVAEEDGELIGHVLYSPGCLKTEAGVLRSLAWGR